MSVRFIHSKKKVLMLSKTVTYKVLFIARQFSNKKVLGMNREVESSAHIAECQLNPLSSTAARR